MILFFVTCFGSAVNNPQSAHSAPLSQEARAKKLLYTLQNMEIKREAMAAYQNFIKEAQKVNTKLNAITPESRTSANIDMEKIYDAQPIPEKEIRSVLSDFKGLRYEGYKGNPSLEEIGSLLDKVGAIIPRIFWE